MKETNSTATKLDFLNGESADGELLSDKLARGSIAPGEALRYALDIGEALVDAHARGLVHGGLSANCVAIGPAGAVLLQPLPGDEAALRYRAPEQVMGNAPDERSDIFAYGVLLYEMAAGEAPFRGQGFALNAAILDDNPPPIGSGLRVHEAMEKVSAACLRKDPASRRQRMQNAVSELKLSAHASDGACASPDAPRGRAAKPKRQAIPPIDVTTVTLLPLKNGLRVPVRILISGALLLAAMSVGAILLVPTRGPAPFYRFTADMQDGKYAAMPAISPDGHSLAWPAIAPDGKRVLWLQQLDRAHAQPIAGSEGAWVPFWSPDSEYVAFFADGYLKKLRVHDGAASGAPSNICPADTFAGGGAWNADGTILFAPSLSGGLARVAASGGVPQPVTSLREVNGERAHLWPQFLPGGKRFIFFVDAGIGEGTGVYAGSLDSPNYNQLFASRSNAVFAQPAGGAGYLLFLRDRALVAQPFNSSQLETTGEPRTLATGVDPVESLSLAQISASRNGKLVYESAGQPERQLQWFDRTGKPESMLGEPGDWGLPRISPDGNRVAIGKRDPGSGFPAIWVLPAGDGSGYQLTHMRRASAGPVWSPDGSRIAYASDDSGAYDLYVQPASAESQPELLYQSPNRKGFDDWSRDGKTLLFDEFVPGLNRGIHLWNLAARRATTLVDTVHAEGYAALSPDGKWLAYQSDETGVNEIVVQPFAGGSPASGKLYPISHGGGALPRWRRDGGELYFITQPGEIFAVAVHPSNGEFRFDPPRALFHTRPTRHDWNLYDAAPDGSRFLVNSAIDWPREAKLEGLANWLGEP